MKYKRRPRKKLASDESEWFLYVLECSDGSFYTGISTDVDRRLHEHNHTKKGSKYTRSRRPVSLITKRQFKNRSDASKSEAKFKKLTRQQKIEEMKNFKDPEIGDIVLVSSSAGDVIPDIHVRLLKRVVVKERKGRRVGMRMSMDWPGYSGWEATLIYQDEIDLLKKEWGIPFTAPDKDMTFVYDRNIIKIVKLKNNLKLKNKT